MLSFYYFICFKLPLHENSCFKHLDTTPTHRASFLNLLLLDTCVDLSTSSSLSAPFSCISYVFHVLHFFIPFVSIASCCYVFLLGILFLAFLVLFMSVFCSSLVKFFSFLCPLTIVSKSGRNLRTKCHSSREVIDLREELHVKGKKFFYLT